MVVSYSSAPSLLLQPIPERLPPPFDQITHNKIFQLLVSKLKGLNMEGFPNGVEKGGFGINELINFEVSVMPTLTHYCWIFPFYTLWKHQNLWFSNVFKRYKKETPGSNGLIHFSNNRNLKIPVWKSTIKKAKVVPMKVRVFLLCTLNYYLLTGLPERLPPWL